MPAIIPFIPLIAAGVGAAGTGLAIDQAVTSGGGASGPTAAEQAQTKAAQTLAQQKAAFLSNQAQGTQPTSASNGLATPTSPTSATDLQAMLKLLSPGGTATGSTNISGGIDGATTPPPQVTNGLTNLAV